MLSFLKSNIIVITVAFIASELLPILPFGFHVKMNDFDLNTHQGAPGLHVKNRFVFWFCGMQKSNCN